MQRKFFILMIIQKTNFKLQFSVGDSMFLKEFLGARVSRFKKKRFIYFSWESKLERGKAKDKETDLQSAD